MSGVPEPECVVRPTASLQLPRASMAVAVTEVGRR